MRYSPHDLLPAPEPSTVHPPNGYFYEKVVRYLLPDAIRIMMNGIPIDLDKVHELEETVAVTLAEVEQTMKNNTLISEFQSLQHTKFKQCYINEKESKKRDFEYYLKPFVHNKMEHRSYFMAEFIKDKPITPPTDLLPTNVPKWPVRAVKQYLETYPSLSRLISGEVTEENNTFAKEAMINLATDRSIIYNKTYEFAIEGVDTNVEHPRFNPGSSDQKRQLFDWLKIDSEEFSKDTGLASWDRDQVERVNKETDDEKVREFTQAFIDYSFGAIIRDNFIPAFYNYTIRGRLYGSVKLFGAKSFRLTSSNPNLLNMPSTRSIYAKPVKKCFVAPEGHVVLAIDYGALEDRVIASLARDENKCAVFTEGLDGHCLNAYGYFKKEIEQYMELTGDINTDVKQFYELSDGGHKELKAIRQKGKPATFGLSYGSYPPKVAKTLKIPIEEAEGIFSSYHNELYPGITEYRENYVLTTAQANKRIHMGLGCYIKTDKARKDIRTLNNATCQFWSILTLLTINKMHILIDEAGLQNEVQCVSTIYDSIYYIVKNDAEIIKWVNDRLVPIMITDFMTDQVIKNEATAEVGLNWADMHQVKNEATLEDIKTVLNDLKE